MNVNNKYWKPKRHFNVYDLEWNNFSIKEIDREYSPSSVIGGDYKPFINKYESDSEIARSVVSSETFLYGIKQSQKIEITSFNKNSNQNLKPILAFIHGGYWQELSVKESFFPAINAVKNNIGYAAIDYTLAPDATIDEIVNECKLAIDWLFNNTKKLGFDNKKIILAGSSAGAHLVAMSVIEKLKKSPLGAILVSGIYDIEPLIGTSIDEALNLNKDQTSRNSPINYSLENFPPTVVAWGEFETEQFKKQSKILVNKLIDYGVPVRSLEIKDKNHFDIILDLADLTKPLGFELQQLLNF